MIVPENGTSVLKVNESIVKVLQVLFDAIK